MLSFKYSLVYSHIYIPDSSPSIDMRGVGVSSNNLSCLCIFFIWLSSNHVKTVKFQNSVQTAGLVAQYLILWIWNYTHLLFLSWLKRSKTANFKKEITIPDKVTKYMYIYTRIPVDMLPDSCPLLTICRVFLYATYSWHYIFLVPLDISFDLYRQLKTDNFERKKHFYGQTNR